MNESHGEHITCGVKWQAWIAKSGYKVKHWRGVPTALMLKAAPVIEFVILVGLGDGFEKQLTLTPFTPFLLHLLLHIYHCEDALNMVIARWMPNHLIELLTERA